MKGVDEAFKDTNVSLRIKFSLRIIDKVEWRGCLLFGL